MGTKIHRESYLPGFYSMRDLNEDSSTNSWPFFYGDKNLPNGHYYNGFMPRSLVDGYRGDEKDALKQKMLEHEAVFKNQVCELHRLYRIQRDMMGEAKRNETNKNRASMEPASSSNLHHNPQVPLEEAREWHMAGFRLLNSSYGGPSIPGVEIVNSPTSRLRTYTSWPDEKDSNGLRPSKVRKKLLDLRLPADEYIDLQEGENSKDFKESHLSGYNAPICPPKPESNMKLFIGGSGLKGSNGLTDLNQIIQIEDDDDDDDVGPSSVDFLGRAGNIKDKGINQVAKSSAGYLAETVNVRNGFPISSSFVNKADMRGRVSHICETGSSSTSYYSPSHGPQPNKSFLPPPRPSRDMLNQARHPHGTHPSGYYNREDVWRDGRRQILESSNRNHSSSYFTTSWVHPIPSWASPTSGPAQNSTTLETCPKPLFFQRNNEPTLNRSYKEVQIRPPLTGYDHINCSRTDNVAALDRSTTHHGSSLFLTGPCHVSPKPSIDINLIPHDTNGESKPEDHRLASLPWLKPKPVTDSKVTLSYATPEIQTKDEIPETPTVKKILGIPIFKKSEPENEHSSVASASTSVSRRPEGKNDFNERKNGLIDINVACKPDEQIAQDELFTSEKENPKKGDFVRDHMIDLNSCLSDSEDYRAANLERKTASVKITLEIDLEVPVFLDSEDDSSLSKENSHEDELNPQLLEKSKIEPIKDDVLQSAAETIFAISSSGPQNVIQPEVPLAEAINWFVDAISSCPSNEIDEFEAMTLELAESKEEDYMPKPFVLEVSKTEEENGTNAFTTRSRRGPTRRGRQRKDFQRDILPGLTTLSRHEVTEDLQIFGGLMRATGHSWNLGLMRRNGGGRGRRRAAAAAAVVENNRVVCGPAVGSLACASLSMKQIGINNNDNNNYNNNNNDNRGVEHLEDQRLTGWGKTTRRPRRQRCPAGSISTVVLT